MIKIVAETPLAHRWHSLAGKKNNIGRVLSWRDALDRLSLRRQPEIQSKCLADKSGAAARMWESGLSEH
jgi:hypothetical protein